MPNDASLGSLWDRLLNVRQLKFEAKSKSAGAGWDGEGLGAVIVESPNLTEIRFRETGRWTSESGKTLNFTNIYRWTVPEKGNTARLEHLRFGESNPVYLFDVEPLSDGVWQSVSPHLCREDLYTARLDLLDNAISLQWRVVGPTLQQEIAYTYW